MSQKYMLQEMVEMKPKVGEYCYYDARLAERTIKRHPCWLVSIKDYVNDYGLVGCHYSLPEQKEKEPFVTCLGIITSVSKKSL